LLDPCWRDRLTGPLRGVCLNRDFLLFTGGTFSSATGLWIQTVAIGWLVLEMTGSAFALGLVGFARLIPILLLGLPAGALADRLDHRRFLVFTQTGAFAVATCLAAAAWLDLLSVPLILVLALLAGVCDAFSWPFISVLVKDIVGPEQFRLAVAINQARFNLTRVIGPAIGGFALAAFGAPVALTITAVSVLGIIAALMRVRADCMPKSDPGPWLAGLRDGVRYAWTIGRVRRLLLITAGVGFFVLPLQQLLPTVARDQLGLGPQGLGWLTTAVGVGAIAGAILSPTRFVQQHTRHFLVGLPLGAAIGLGLLGQVDTFVPALAALALIGFCAIAHMTISSATLQLMVREQVTGRVVGLMTVLMGGTTPLGALALGALADRLGIGATFAMAAVGVALVALGAGLPLTVWHDADQEEATPLVRTWWARVSELRTTVLALIPVENALRRTLGRKVA
jgi:MFS family permease